MTRTTIVRFIVVAIIVAVLGTASLIVANSSAGSVADAPSAWGH